MTELRLHTLQRYAIWTEPWGSQGGPVLELEVGYWVARMVLSPHLTPRP